MVASRARHESGQPLGRDLRGEILVVVEFVEHQGETDAELDDHDGDQDEEEVSNHVGGERIVEAGRFGHALPIAVGVHVLGPLDTDARSACAETHLTMLTSHPWVRYLSRRPFVG